MVYRMYPLVIKRGWKITDKSAVDSWSSPGLMPHAMGLISFVSSAWLHVSTGVSEHCLWQCGEYNPGFYHLAWGCPCHTHHLEPPENILLARFGQQYFQKYYQEKTKQPCVCDICGCAMSCKSNLAKHKKTKKCRRFLVWVHYDFMIQKNIIKL